MRRRMRNTRRRISKGKKDWVVGVWGSEDDQPLGVAGTQFYTLVDDSVLEQKDDKLTVLRIVGDLWTHPGGTDAVTIAGGIKYWWGIKVFELDSAGQLLPQTPVDFVDADGNWMFLRVGFFGSQVNISAANRYYEVFQSEHMYGNSGWGQNHIDIQVKRKMGARDVLILAMGAQAYLPLETAYGSCTSVSHSAFMRVLVSNL